MKKLYFLLLFFIAFQIQSKAQVWSESFENSTNIDDYTRNTGFEFRNTGTGALDLEINTTDGGNGNSAVTPTHGQYALYNKNSVQGAGFEFISSYFYISVDDFIAFHYENNNSSARLDYTITLIDTNGNETVFYTELGFFSNSTKEFSHIFTGTNFDNAGGEGWYRVSFNFLISSGGNASAKYMLDNFRSSVSQFAPYLVELELDCNTYKSFGISGDPDSMTYETIIINNGPDTIVANEAVHVIVTLPSTPLLTFEDFIVPAGTTLSIDDDDPNIAIWEIQKINVGEALTLTTKSSYSDANHGMIAANSSILGGLPDLYIDPNSETNNANCFILLLPVSISDFSANHIENVVTVNWTTTSETNNQGFEVYSSTDADNWEYLGFVDGVGNSNSETNYRFFDNTPLTQTRLYKLVQIDYDGKTEEFGPVRIDIDNRFLNKNITVFPNPSNGIVSINVVNSHTASNIANTVVNVYSITGQVVHNVALDFSTTNNQSIDLSHLPKGQYIIKLSSNDQVHAVKVILD